MIFTTFAVPAKVAEAAVTAKIAGVAAAAKDSLRIVFSLRCKGGGLIPPLVYFQC